MKKIPYEFEINFEYFKKYDNKSLSWYFKSLSLKKDSLTYKEDRLICLLNTKKYEKMALAHLKLATQAIT